MADSRSLFSPEIREFIEQNFKTMRDKQLAPAINERFGTDITDRQVLKYRDNNNLRKYSAKRLSVQKERAETQRIKVCGAVTIHRIL